MKYLCKWTLYMYIYLQISWQHVNNQIDVISFRETSSLFFLFCLALSDFIYAFLSWCCQPPHGKIGIYIYIYTHISCYDVTPFHSARQYASTGFEVTSLRCGASFVWSKGAFNYTCYLYKHFPALVMNCSSQLDQPHRWAFIKQKSFRVKCVVCSEVGRLTMLIGFVLLYWPLQGRKMPDTSLN